MHRLIIAGLLILSSAPVMADDLIFYGGLTGSNGLGQKGYAPLGGVMFGAGNDNRLELCADWRRIRKIESGRGYQYTAHIRYMPKVYGPVFLLAGINGIHANGGIWTKDTADFSAGAGLRYNFASTDGHGVVQGWFAYNRDIASHNSPNQRNIHGLEAGFRITAGRAGTGIFSQFAVLPLRYEQLTGNGFESRQGSRVTATAGIIFSW